jgi:hypothetical protein
MRFRSVSRRYYSRRHMEPTLVTDPALSDVLRALSAREPIFHRPEHGTTRASIEKMTDASFWEVGASGRRYSREFVLDELDRRRASGENDAPWHTRDFHCRQLSADIYLLTYTLEQTTRITRRSTIWRRAAEGWVIVYHQGTVVESL